MPIIKQNSRVSHHTITTSGSTGSTFTIPSSEDFTVRNAWIPTDLALSEFGIDSFRNKLYIRIGSNINEVPLNISGTTSSGTTNNYWISGSSGNYSTKIINDSFIDATGNYSLAIGRSTLAAGNNSFAGGLESVSSGQTSFVFGTSSKAIADTCIVLGNNLTGNSGNTIYVSNLVSKVTIVPTGSTDTIGENGSISYDNNYFYWKSGGQWLRIIGLTF